MTPDEFYKKDSLKGEKCVVCKMAILTRSSGCATVDLEKGIVKPFHAKCYREVLRYDV